MGRRQRRRADEVGRRSQRLAVAEHRHRLEELTGLLLDRHEGEEVIHSLLDRPARIQVSGSAHRWITGPCGSAAGMWWINMWVVIAVMLADSIRYRNI